MNKLYYNSLGMEVKYTLRRLSNIKLKHSQLEKRKRIVGWISGKIASCKRSFTKLKNKASFTTVKSNPEAKPKESKVLKSSLIVESPKESIDIQVDKKENNDIQISEPPTPPEVPVIEKLQSNNEIPILRSEETNESEGCLSSDHDSVFLTESIVKSPPTPPKHIKKSYRKRGGRSEYRHSDYVFSSNTSQNNSFETRRTPSPVLGNIIQSLRRSSSTSPKRISSDVPKKIGKISMERLRKVSGDSKWSTTVSDNSDSSCKTSPVVAPKKMNSLVYTEKDGIHSQKGLRRKLTGKTSTSENSSSAGEWDDLLFETYNCGLQDAKINNSDIFQNSGHSINVDKILSRSTNSSILPSSSARLESPTNSNVLSVSKLKRISSRSKDRLSSLSDNGSVIPSSSKFISSSKLGSISPSKASLFAPSDTRLSSHSIDELFPHSSAKSVPSSNASHFTPSKKSLVSDDDKHDSMEIALEESFSPKSSSSPDPSHSSPERFSSSPEEHSSAGEWSPEKITESPIPTYSSVLDSVVKPPDLYRIYTSDSPRVADENGKHEFPNSIPDPVDEEIARYERISPRTSPYGKSTSDYTSHYIGNYEFPERETWTRSEKSSPL